MKRMHIPLACLGLAGLANPGWGQAPASAGPMVLENVVVTAQRRQERLVDVPISITALDAEDLLRSGVNSTADLARITPGVQLTFNGGYLQPAIRGVSSQGSNAGDSSNVAMYLDGVYIASQIGQLMDLPDVQSVQVLKGPQGTLYGQNATGGAIIVSTVSPSLDEMTGRLSLSYGNYDAVDARGYVSGPLTDRLAGSLAVAVQERDGFRDDLVYGGQDKGLRSQLVRGKLLFEATDNIELLLTAYTSERKDSAAYAGRAYQRESFDYLVYPTAAYPDVDEIATSFTPDTEMDSDGVSLQVNFELPFGKLQSTTAWTDNEAHLLVDVDYGPAHFVDVSVNQAQETFVQELNFTSEQMGDWLFSGGLFYLDSSDEFTPNVFRIQSPPILAPAPSAPTVFYNYSWGGVDKEIYAVYAEATYDISDAMQVIFGGRYSEEEQISKTNPNPFIPDKEIVESPYSPETFSKFTPRVSLRYALSDDANLYATYSQGFKSGILSGQNPPADPEELDAYEIGFKGNLGERVSASAALYYYDYNDLQVARYEAPNYVYQNAASAQITGAEFNATWQASEGLTLATGVSLLDAEYDDFPSAGSYVWNPANFATPNESVNIDASGVEMVRAPKITGFINADYRVDTSIGTFGAFASWYYNDGFNLEFSEHVTQDAYSMLDAELSWSPSAAAGLSLVLWGRNLTDEDVLQSLLQTNFANGVSYAAPRTFGARVEFEF
ncbi:TonB-dependent receptor [Mangrovimicrobium sediminis]|nr:TonB-dependent receptor [Haliea sp. SAOS-164]